MVLHVVFSCETSFAKRTAVPPIAVMDSVEMPLQAVDPSEIDAALVAKMLVFCQMNLSVNCVNMSLQMAFESEVLVADFASETQSLVSILDVETQVALVCKSLFAVFAVDVSFRRRWRIEIEIRIWCCQLHDFMLLNFRIDLKMKTEKRQNLLESKQTFWHASEIKSIPTFWLSRNEIIWIFSLNNRRFCKLFLVWSQFTANSTRVSRAVKNC